MILVPLVVAFAEERGALSRKKGSIGAHKQNATALRSALGDVATGRGPVAVRWHDSYVTVIDTNFDVRQDAGTGDPDTTSPTLREYHRLLWSKALPAGGVLALDTSNRRRYLYHHSELGEFFLASDTVIPTWRSWTKMSKLIAQIPEVDLDSFQRLNHTIGGMIVFPGERRPGVQTINGARGFSWLIADRFDLTMECIRRHYRGEAHPLASTLNAYSDFFALFGNFHGYTEFFLLQDLVTADHQAVKFFTDFDDFRTPALPGSVDEYLSYRERAMVFITSRNRRILIWAQENLTDSNTQSGEGGLTPPLA